MYDCIVSNSCGSTTTNAVPLSLLQDVAITQSPSNQTKCAGEPVNFSVTATGSGPLTYQWRLNGSDLPGEVSPLLSIPVVHVDDAGTYTCVVTGACGSETSPPAVLTVRIPVMITDDPDAAGVCDGGSVSFSVSATGTTPLYYQWFKNGQPIIGAEASSYEIDPVTGDDPGAYSCEVTNVCGGVLSAEAMLELLPPTDITGQPSSQNACPGDEVTFTVTAGGAGTLTYQWKKDGTDISGAESASHVIDPVSAGDAATYTCVVTGTCGSVTSQGATLTVETEAAIMAHPVSVETCEGEDVSFSVSATGTNLDYQWRKDSVIIGGATGTALDLYGVTTADAGDYDCVVTGPCNSVTSDAATLTVDEGTFRVAVSPCNFALGLNPVTLTTDLACGTPSYVYEWRNEGTGQVLGSSDHLVLDPPPASTTTYVVDVTDGLARQALGYATVLVHPSGVDLSGDGQNTFLDLCMAMDHWRENAPTYDADADGIVTVIDFLHINLGTP